jgi:transcription initiation factor TFIID subunit 2
VDSDDPTRKVATFLSASLVSPLHIGFAIGPFQTINISDFRDPEDEDKLGQNAIPVQAYCLPGRAEEVQNTCLPMAKVGFLTGQELY